MLCLSESTLLGMKVRPGKVIWSLRLVVFFVYYMKTVVVFVSWVLLMFVPTTWSFRYILLNAWKTLTVSMKYCAHSLVAIYCAKNICCPGYWLHYCFHFSSKIEINYAFFIAKEAIFTPLSAMGMTRATTPTSNLYTQWQGRRSAASSMPRHLSITAHTSAHTPWGQADMSPVGDALSLP